MAKSQSSKSFTFQRILKAFFQDKLEYVLFTDLSDVEFIKNPFVLMEQMDSATNQDLLYVGSEYRPFSKVIVRSETFSRNVTKMDYYRGLWTACFGSEMPAEYLAGTLWNSGIIGGKSKVVLRFLESIVRNLELADARNNCNMAAMWKSICEDWNENVVTGFPLHSKFNHKDPANQARVFIRHK